MVSDIGPTKTPANGPHPPPVVAYGAEHVHPRGQKFESKFDPSNLKTGAKDEIPPAGVGVVVVVVVGLKKQPAPPFSQLAPQSTYTKPLGLVPKFSRS